MLRRGCDEHLTRLWVKPAGHLLCTWPSHVTLVSSTKHFPWRVAPRIGVLRRVPRGATMDWRNSAACLDEDPELFSRSGTRDRLSSRSKKRRLSAVAAQPPRSASRGP